MSAKAVAILAAVFVVATGVVSVTTRSAAREITLVAKEMAFYLAGDEATPNPVIEARPGETLRIVLQNRERGMTHDFAVPAADAATRVLNWNEDGAVTFEVPKEPGTYEYVCRPHLLMMRGTLRVVASE